MRKSIVQPDRPQTTIQYGACALHAGYLRLHTHTYAECVTLIAFPRQWFSRARLSFIFANCAAMYCESGCVVSWIVFLILRLLFRLF